MFSTPICVWTGVAGPMSDSRGPAPAPVCRAWCGGEATVRFRVPRMAIDRPPPGDSVTVARLRIRDRRRYPRQPGLDGNGRPSFVPRAGISGMGATGHDGEGVTGLYGGLPLSVRLTFRPPVGGGRVILTALALGWERGAAPVRSGRGGRSRSGGIPFPAGSRASGSEPGEVRPDRQAGVNGAIHIVDHFSLLRVSAGSASSAGRVPRAGRGIGERIAAIRDGTDGRRAGRGK